MIGAGAAGLATAAVLRRRGVDVTVVDRADQVGGAWPNRYDSLRLNTVRWMSDLPGHRMPRALGRWVGRDDVSAYLTGYADHHGLRIELGVAVDRIATSASRRWRVVAGGGARVVDAVVVATGHSAVPTTPDWAGAADFRGRLVHGADYVRAADHAGRRVLVVGAGSTGGEICVDLVGAGADVTWSVRTAPRVFPREIRGVPTTPFAPLVDALPDGWVDRAAPRIERRAYGPRDYLPEPSESMLTLLARCKEPMTADGIVELLRSGRVRVVAPVSDLTPDGARLADDSFEPADDVIAATGYRTGLAPLVRHLDVLDAAGRPRALVPRPNLAFVGYRIPFTGTLWAIDHDARVVARALTR